MVKKILLGLLAVLLIMQFFQIDKTNPAVDPQQDFFTAVNAPADIQNLVKDACYDCHSNTTEYPWYAYVQPVGWWLKDHVNHGKGELNFSEWTTYKLKKAKHKMEECYEEVEKGVMPLKSYTYTHAESRLTEEQKNALVTWFKNQYESM